MQIGFMVMLLGLMWTMSNNLLDLSAMFVLIELLQSVLMWKLMHFLVLKAVLQMSVQRNYLILFLFNL